MRPRAPVSGRPAPTSATAVPSLGAPARAHAGEDDPTPGERLPPRQQPPWARQAPVRPHQLGRHKGTQQQHALHGRYGRWPQGPLLDGTVWSPLSHATTGPPTAHAASDNESPPVKRTHAWGPSVRLPGRSDARSGGLDGQTSLPAPSAGRRPPVATDRGQIRPHRRTGQRSAPDDRAVPREGTRHSPRRVSVIGGKRHARSIPAGAPSRTMPAHTPTRVPPDAR